MTLVPTELQMSMLSKTVASQRLAPTDPCRALLPLAALSSQVEGLSAANIIDQSTTVTLSTDIQSLEAALQPGDPC